MAEGRDYYSILQVNRRASAEEIDRSYERLSKLYDPEASKKRRASERWQQIKEAYETLSDPDKRAEYDRAANPRRLPGIAGETAVTRFLASRYGLPSIAALIGAIVIVAVLVAVFAGGGGDDNAVADITTPPPTTPSPSPIPSPSPLVTPEPLADEGITTDSGLQIITIEEGTGDQAAANDKVVVDYTGWLQSDLTKFDSSVDRGEPFQTTVGVGSVIKGWDEGLQLMKEGGKARFIIPPDLAYGDTGQGSIPPGATLIFDIHLIDVIKQGETPMPTASPTPAPSPTPSPEPSDDVTPTPEATS